MPASIGYVIWFLGVVLEVTVVVCALKRHTFRRYLCLNLYMLFTFLVSVGRHQILSHFGLRSSEYWYFYYYSDAVLTIFLYLALITLYLHVFDEMKVEKWLRLTAVLLLAGTAMFSYGVVHQSFQSSGKMLATFVFELSQNLYFVGLVLTYVLWGAILKLRETRTQLIQLVLSLRMHSGDWPPTHGWCRLGSRWCHANGYANFLSLRRRPAAVFHFVLPLAHSLVHQAASFRRGSRRHRHPQHRFWRRLRARHPAPGPLPRAPRGTRSYTGH